MVSQKDSCMSVVGPYCMLDGEVRSLSGIRGLCQHTVTNNYYYNNNKKLYQFKKKKLVLPEWPTVNISIGSDPLLLSSNKSGFSDRLLKSRLILCQKSCPNDSCAHTVSGPPELLLRSCFFLRLALPFKLTCLVSRSLLSLPPGNVSVRGEPAGAEPRRAQCRK